MAYLENPSNISSEEMIKNHSSLFVCAKLSFRRTCYLTDNNYTCSQAN